MRLRSLESRIVALFLLLILAVQLAGFVFIRLSINENARTAIRTELVVGERVFKRLLEQNAEKLTQGAGLLASDYGFKQAIGSDDRETIASVLANHGGRIGAALTLLVGPDGKIKTAATATPSASLERSILALVAKAEQSGNAAGTSIVDNHPYQIVVVPVRAPITIGWVAMAFPIDQKLAGDMRDLTSLQVSILTSSPEGEWIPGTSTLPNQDVMSLAKQLQGSPDKPVVMNGLSIGGDEYSARILQLTRDAGQNAIAILQRSVDEATAPYLRLQITLLILTLLGIVVAVGGSIFTAKRITGPLRALTETAKRLGAGDYQGKIAMPREDEIGELSRAFESMRDGISHREAEIRHLAYWDPLTDLPNRAQFVNLLNQAIAAAKTRGETCFILMMDLDRFKNVNDILGHSFGDALLAQVAQRLQGQFASEREPIARLGGDEFAMLLPNSTLAHAQTVAARILTALEVPISLDEHTVDLGAGIGIAGFPDHGSDAESLLSRAEVAMYASKKSGDEAVVYDVAIDKASQKNLSLLSELRHAVDNNEFRLQVQPKVLLATGRVVGLEALIRWVHPEKGLVFPDDFIPFAEKTGFIRRLTFWVLEQSAALCSEWQAKGVHLKMSVNLSTRDLLDPDLPAKFAEILMRHKVAPTSFCLEITESAIMDDPVRAQQTLERLHAMDIELAIDDFGTGYSSLAYLKRLPVDELKIDKSFVMNMELDADDAKIVRSTIDLGHNMGLRVVAEGIESEAVWRELVKMGCDQGQGYFISRPMPADQLVHWLDKWEPPAVSSKD